MRKRDAVQPERLEMWAGSAQERLREDGHHLVVIRLTLVRPEPNEHHDRHGGRQELQQLPHGGAGRAEKLQVQTARRRKDETAPPPTNVRQRVPSPRIISEIHPVEIEYVKEHVVGEHVECHTSCTRSNGQQNLRTSQKTAHTSTSSL